jgi:hypothetical protein
MGELAVTGKRPDGEVDIPAGIGGCDVCSSVRHEVFDELDDGADALADARLGVGLQASARAQLLGVDVGHSPREIERRLTSLPRALEDLVVDVGDVPDVRHPVSTRSEEPDEDVERDEGSGMAGVRVVIGRRAANVETDVGRVRRREELEPLAHGIVQADGARRHGR